MQGDWSIRAVEVITVVEGNGAVWSAGTSAERQRAGVHRVCDPRLVESQAGEDDLYHAGIAVGERLHRELPRQAAGRMLEPEDLSGSLAEARVVIEQGRITRSGRIVRWDIRRLRSLAVALSVVLASDRASPSSGQNHRTKHQTNGRTLPIIVQPLGGRSMADIERAPASPG